MMDLPVELLFVVFSFLAPEDFVNLSLASRKCYFLLSDKSFWSIMFRKEKLFTYMLNKASEYAGFYRGYLASIRHMKKSMLMVESVRMFEVNVSSVTDPEQLYTPEVGMTILKRLIKRNKRNKDILYELESLEHDNILPFVDGYYKHEARNLASQWWEASYLGVTFSTEIDMEGIGMYTNKKVFTIATLNSSQDFSISKESLRSIYFRLLCDKVLIYEL